jgi:23S rRNA (cytosine1962-C5)-methyltransferase
MAAVVASAPTLLLTRSWSDYGLLDSGDGRKLERYGPLRVVRPEPQCFWRPALSPEVWAQAHAVFEPAPEDDAGRWRFSDTTGEPWPMRWENVSFWGRFSNFRHLAVFPEHASNWAWIAERVAAAHVGGTVMNLFGYTGVASLAAAAAGARVTHVDASKKSVAWGKANAELSGLQQAPIRWICEDARKWVQREVRRGARYNGVILDPPKFGRGPDGEVWRLHEHLPALIADCAALIADGPGFLLVNAYAERITGLALAHLLAEYFDDGAITWGELALAEESAGRAAGLSFFARWERR